MRLLAIAVGFGILSLTVAAVGRPQQSTSKPSDIIPIVAGHVLDAVSGAPIQAAVVTLRSAGGETRRGLTSSSGSFAFADVRGSSVSLSASKAGYETGRLGQQFPGDDGSVVADTKDLRTVKLLLWRLATVRSAVVDEAREPVVGALISAFRVTIVGGRKRLITAATARSDDRGEYDLTLTPFLTYVIGIGSDHTASELTLQSPLFYPVSSDAAGAQQLRPSPGETIYGVDLSVVERPAVTVTGRLLGYDNCSRVIDLKLSAESELPMDVPLRSTKSTADCRFRFDGVPPGNYRIRGVSFPPPVAGHTNPRQVGPGRFTGSILARNIDGMSSPLPVLGDLTTYWAELPISVRNTNVDDVTVHVHTGATVSGRFVFEGRVVQPDPDILARSAVIVSPGDGSSLGDVPIGAVAANGRFETVGFPPGKYVIQLLPLGSWKGWSISGIILDGQDVWGASFELGSRNVTNVEFHLSSQPPVGTITGVVAKIDGTPAPGMSIFVFSKDRRYWIDYGAQPPWRMWEYHASASGYFSTAHLPDGEYFVVAGAWPDNDWRTPTVLARWVPFASSVKLGAGETHNLRLTARGLPGP